MTAGGQTDSPPFEFTILTLEADDTFTPPLYDGGTYDFVIDWVTCQAVQSHHSMTKTLPTPMQMKGLPNTLFLSLER